MSSRVLAPALRLVAILNVLSCRGDDAPVGPQVEFVADPQSVTAPVGAVVPIKVVLTGSRGAGSTVRFMNSHAPGIAAIDTTVPVGQPALLRALQAGQTHIDVILTTPGGFPLGGVVQVTVTPAP